MDAWTRSAALQNGVLFRPVGKTGKVRGSGFTAKVIWSIVRKAAADCGFGTVAPMISVELAHASAIRPEASWNRSSSC